MVGLGGICGQGICGRKATLDLNNRGSSELRRDQKTEGGGAGSHGWTDCLAVVPQQLILRSLSL